VKKRALVCLALLSTLIVPLSSATAHTVLIASDPAANSTVTQLPEQVTLTFAEPLIAIGKKKINVIQVVDPMGATISTPDTAVKGAVLSNVLSPKMVMPGKFHVFFRVVAQDGHLVTGDFYFSVGKPPVSRSSAPIPKGLIHITAEATSAGIMSARMKSDLTAVLSLDLDFNKKQVCYSISSNVKDVLAIHIHSMNQMNMSISDEIFIPLQPKSINSKELICDLESPSAMSMIYHNISHYMVVIHTKQYPDGAIAGTLKLSQTKK